MTTLLQNFPAFQSESAFRQASTDWCTKNNITDDFPNEKFKVIRDNGKVLDIEFTKMYGWDLVSQIVVRNFIDYVIGDEYNADIYDDISIGGCQTCDYNSKYGYCVRIWRK